MSYENVVAGSGAGTHLLHGAVGLASHTAGGALGAWAFTAVSPVHGAVVGLSMALAHLISRIVLAVIRKDWPRSEWLSPLPIVAATTTALTVLRSFGATSLVVGAAVGIPAVAAYALAEMILMAPVIIDRVRQSREDAASLTIRA